MKKVFIISAVLLAVILLFLGIYNFAFKKDAPAIQQTIAEPVGTSSTALKTEKITAISDGAVLGLIMDKKTQELTYYDALTGFVWKMDADGKGKQQITNTKVLDLKNVSWSPNQNKVLTTIQKDGQSSFYMYDYQSKKGVSLQKGIDAIAWDNLGTKIFYKFFDATAKIATLNIANPDGSDWQKIADINRRYLSIAPIPLTSLVSYWNFPNALEETQLQAVGVTGGEPRTILSGKYGGDYLWSPDGSRALVSSLASKDAKTVMLGLVTVDGKYQDLNIPTIASKSVWSQDGKTIYYALPGGIPTGAIMPNDYQENKFKTKDTFWEMNIATGEKSRIIETGDIKGEYDVSNLILSTTEGALYFVNKIDQKLYRLQL